MDGSFISDQNLTFKVNVYTDTWVQYTGDWWRELGWSSGSALVSHVCIIFNTLVSMVLHYLKILALEVSQPPKNFSRFLCLLIFFLVQNKLFGSHENCCPDGESIFFASLLENWAFCQPGLGWLKLPGYVRRHSQDCLNTDSNTFSSSLFSDVLFSASKQAEGFRLNHACGSRWLSTFLCLPLS